ncbi:hypothetical protein [Aeromonas caviae]|uniref:hypothetical protein n=1 Tax=Aeromonas caviae TaxID=648 RepID=UPI002B4A44F1|nr:hypothetical protein [Aeromonas caviae]
MPSHQGQHPIQLSQRQPDPTTLGDRQALPVVYQVTPRRDRLNVSKGEIRDQVVPEQLALAGQSVKLPGIHAGRPLGALRPLHGQDTPN